MSQSQSYLITFQGVDELSWTSTVYSKIRAKVKPKLYIEVYVDQKKVARTSIAQNNLWGETLTIPQVKESSELLIRLKHRSFQPTDPCFGVVEGTVGHLLSLCEGREVAPLKLTHGLKKSMYDAQGVISAGIKASDDENVSDNADLLKSLGTVINKIQCIAAVTLDAVDALAKVHPYADVAWKILSSVHKAYEHQKDTDGAVVALFKQMEDLYSFVGDVESLPGQIKQLEHTIVRILEQTTECGIFFREYTDHGFVARFLGQAVSNRSQMISNLSTTLVQLKNDLNSGVQLHTAFMSSHTRDGVDRLAKSDILKVLDPAKMNAAERPMCLPGTMQDRQKEIIEWLMSPSEQNQNVMWLHRGAGLGKSTLATTIAESVAFSPDGQCIASGSDNTTIRIWDATTGALIAGPFEVHTSGVMSVVFSPDGLVGHYHPNLGRNNGRSHCWAIKRARRANSINGAFARRNASRHVFGAQHSCSQGP
ncbi:hypothetical protein FIBSPDRAFT_832245 [Athelia psychrophila]|uniref:C2 domain-containing protein n=1 Tax=Athelia psychrophila TaxID=1759441 RepID=A0A166EP72_9AGAM|nr:hypothetical protein FIBSPDRAFT_832245 [Fibularhizoctonia sp. CBS 109695]